MKTLKLAVALAFSAMAGSMMISTSAPALTLPELTSAGSAPVELVAGKSAKPRKAVKNRVTTFCYDSAFRCIHTITGVCDGYLYTDFWGEKRCSRNRNGRRQAQFGFSWGTGLDW